MSWAPVSEVASPIRETDTTAPPPTMNGRRRSQTGWLKRSDHLPNTGCTSAPITGPIPQAKAQADVLKPRDSRKGCSELSEKARSVCINRSQGVTYRQSRLQQRPHELKPSILSILQSENCSSDNWRTLQCHSQVILHDWCR